MSVEVGQRYIGSEIDKVVMAVFDGLLGEGRFVVYYADLGVDTDGQRWQVRDGYWADYYVNTEQRFLATAGRLKG